MDENIKRLDRNGVESFFPSVDQLKEDFKIYIYH